MTHTEFKAGPDLDRMVFEKVSKKRVIGKALCVSVGMSTLTGVPLQMEVVSGPEGPAQKKGHLRDVYVKVCLCKEPAYNQGPLSDRKVHGHLIECLEAVPMISEIDEVAIDALNNFFLEWEVCKRHGKYEITLYKPNVFAEGGSLALAICRAIVKARMI